MATNHTTNYQLCQWEATDKVLRTDFNEDNQKIDAALASLSSQIPLIRLKHFVLSADTKSYALDLEDVDLEDYAALRFAVKSTAGIIGPFGLQLNGIETGYEYDTPSSANPSDADLILLSTNSPFISRADLIPLNDMTLFFCDSCFVTEYRVEGHWIRGVHRTIPYSSIQSVSLVCLHESNKLAAGTEVMIYGLKTI